MTFFKIKAPLTFYELNKFVIQFLKKKKLSKIVKLAPLQRIENNKDFEFCTKIKFGPDVCFLALFDGSQHISDIGQAYDKFKTMGQLFKE